MPGGKPKSAKKRAAELATARNSGGKQNQSRLMERLKAAMKRQANAEKSDRLVRRELRLAAVFCRAGAGWLLLCRGFGLFRVNEQLAGPAPHFKSIEPIRQASEERFTLLYKSLIWPIGQYFDGRYMAFAH